MKKKMIIGKLKDGRKIKIDIITKDRIWGTVDKIRSAWNIDGKWRDDGIESNADIIVEGIQLKLEI